MSILAVKDKEFYLRPFGRKRKKKSNNINLRSTCAPRWRLYGVRAEIKAGGGDQGAIQ